MHSEIIGDTDDTETDHVNGNRLDNQRKNLRRATASQNQCNKTPVAGTSKYKGVSWDSRSRRWLSRITQSGILYQLGSYKSERDAAWVYNVWAESMFGKYARLNVLQEEIT